ncbi:PREDICTED: transmembrane protein 17B-like [Calidris pugnax]|uniref:transmembrane protein 17B-like n=1 Tax=Calidris pugnax TaxID=198806 RepID=UPI00071C7BAD|nr:PREDICTED: transmembrane protein 17B-like [Calidris pugnax]
MAAHTPLPPNLRRGLVAFSGSLFINNKTRDSGAAHSYHPAHEVLASLPLQMMLYFNVYYFPVWFLAEGMMLQLKVLSHGAHGDGVTLLLTDLPGYGWAGERGASSRFMGSHTHKQNALSPTRQAGSPLAPRNGNCENNHWAFQAWKVKLGGWSGQGWSQGARHGPQNTGSWAWGRQVGGHRGGKLGTENSARCSGDGAGWDEAVLPLQYQLLPQHYQFLLVAAFLILSLVEGSRLYLGYVGNLQEKVPELAGFLLLSFLIQLPLLLFLLTDSHFIRLPLEMVVHSLLLAFLLAEMVAAFLALKTMTKQLVAQFHLQQLKEGGRGWPGQGGGGSQAAKEE